MEVINTFFFILFYIPGIYELQQEFNELQKQQETKLRQYHELKMETIKNIERKKQPIET